MSELWIELSPARRREHWQVRLLNNGVKPRAGFITLPITATELDSLRRSPWERNRSLLEEVGARIWNKVIEPRLGDDVRDRIRRMIDHGAPGVRLIFVLRDPSRAAAGVGLAEVPFEVLFDAVHSFVALRGTSISRTLHSAPELDAQRISCPLRVLIVVATPQGYGDANADQEAAAIAGALDNHIQQRRIDLRSVPNVTVQRLSEHIEDFQPHVVHFIGHGGFESVEGDDAREPFLCFEDGTARRQPRYVKAEVLEQIIDQRGRGSVGLFVMSACSTAAAGNGAPPDPYGPVFDGMAQRIVQNTRAASIGMQFDFEGWAATAFSPVFYGSLVDGVRLDDCVTRGRRQIVAARDAGERAWITPVIYSRYKSGRVFRRAPIASTEALVREESTKSHRDTLAAFWREAIPGGHEDLRETLFRRIAALQHESADVAAKLGTCTWIHGGTGERGGRVGCSLRLTTRATGVLVSFSVKLQHPGLRRVRVNRGTHSERARALTATSLDGDASTQLEVSLPAQYKPWPGGNCELAKIWFEPYHGRMEPEPPMRITDDGCAFVEILLSDIDLEIGGETILCQAVAGLVCLV